MVLESASQYISFDTNMPLKIFTKKSDKGPPFGFFGQKKFRSKKESLQIFFKKQFWKP